MANEMTAPQPAERFEPPGRPQPPERMRPSEGPRTSRTTAELTGDLARQVTSLVHHEVDLAKVELTEKAKRAGVGSGLFGAAGLLGLGAFACVTVTLIAALHIAVPVWAAALAVAVVYGAVAAVLVLSGRRELRQATPPVPQEAIDDTKEEVAWLKRQARSARS